jgi:hypothetical protein
MGFQAFLEGLSSILDFSPLSEKYRDLLERSDEEALRSDWQAVGDDIRTAIGKFEEERTVKNQTR